MSISELWEDMDGLHLEHMRRDGVIAPEYYLADERQSDLVLLLEYVRPNKFICKNFKTRCLEAFVKGASKDNVYWNTVPHAIFPGLPKPAEQRLSAKLEQLGITADNSWGLDLPYTQLLRCFELSTSRITVYHDVWASIASAASNLVEHGIMPHEEEEDTTLGDKLEFMLTSDFSLRELVHGRDPADLILLLGRILSRSNPNNNEACTCRLLSSTLRGHHADEFSPLQWPKFILRTSRRFLGRSLRNSWTEAVHYNPDMDPRAENPLSRWYPFPMMADPAAIAPMPTWIIRWQSKFARVYGIMAIAEPSGNLYTNPASRDSKLQSQFESLLSQGEEIILRCETMIAEQQELVNDEFVMNGGSVLFCVDSQGRNMPTLTVNDEERNRTLRHRMNPPTKRYWECEDDGSDPMEFPERWSRLV